MSVNFFETHIWILKIIISVFLLIFFNLILSYLLRFIKKISKIEKYDSRKNIHKIFYTPLKIFIWIIFLSYSLKILANEFNFKTVIEFIKIIRNMAIVLDVAFLIIRWKKEIEKIALLKWHKMIDKPSIDFLGKILTIIIVFISFLMILQIAGGDIMPLVAFGGIGAAAIGFAAKDVIANFFGGLMLYITRPFVNGDLIEMPSNNLIGHIETIGWYNTCIRELSKMAVYVPNSSFSTALH